MLRRLALISVCFGSMFAIAACSSDDGGNPASGGGGGTGATGGGGTLDPEETGSRPPEPPTTGNPGAGTTATILAASKLYLGESDTSGNATTSAWQSFGFNLDGLASTKTGTNHCKLPANTPPSNKEDGANGVDNSFGRNILPILKSFVSAPSEEVNQAIAEGSFTIMLKMDNLDAEQNQSQVTASLYGGADLGGAPNWDGTDEWPVFPELLNGGNINDPKVKFPNSYVAGGTWVSGTSGTVDLSVSIGGQSLSLIIENAFVTVDITGTGPTATGTNGIIAGVIRTTQLVGEIEKVAGQLTDGQLCPGNPTLEGALASIRQASDIMSDGSNGDASKDCDAISIGIGFEAKGVLLGPVAPPSTGGTDPCVNP